MSRPFAPLLAALLLLSAAALRLPTPDQRLHPDEAYFATFARRAAVQGDWLLHGDLDKPPLTLYAQALALHLVGVRLLPNGVLTSPIRAAELAVRLPSFYAGLLLVVVVGVTARRVARQRAGLWLGLLLAGGSPFLAAFAPTAFTDTPLLLFGMLAWYAALRGRWGWAGLGLALALACKTQAVYLLPLIWLTGTGDVRRKARLILPLLSAGALLLAWDALRGQAVPFWALGAVNNAPAAPLTEALSRLAAWLQLSGYTFGLPLVSALLIGAGLWLYLQDHLGSRFHLLKTAKNRVGIWAAVWLLAYTAWQIFGGWNVYDRYVLLALPPLLVLTSAGLVQWTAGRRWPYAVVAALVLLGAGQRVPVGGDTGAYYAMQRVGAALAARPVASVVYDRWLGWELGFYLGAWSDKRLTYYPTPSALVAGFCSLTEVGERAPRYFPVPRPVQSIAAAWLDALRAAGGRVEAWASFRTVVIYRLWPPVRGVGCASSFCVPLAIKAHQQACAPA